MKIEKLDLKGKTSIEVLDKIFSAKVNHKPQVTFYTKQMPTIKKGVLKQNNKMKFLVQHLRFMPKKEQVMQDTQVEKLQFLLVVVLLMVQKVN